MNVLPPHRTARRYACDDLVDIGVRGIARVLSSLRKQLAVDPDAALEPIEMKRSGKRALHIDKQAEITLKETICGKFSDIEFFGEERLGKDPIDLTDRNGTFVLADALDGTDLFERDLANWCSAAVFFSPTNPPGKRLQAAIVGLPDGSVYFASSDDEGVSVMRRGKKQAEAVHGTGKARRLCEASLCFYGQKIKNLSLFLNSGFMDWVQRQAGARGKGTSGLRIYNLAGIPMIVKMIDPPYQGAAAIDVVFELGGQQAHDVVAGAYLALRAGAAMVSPEGKAMTILDLEGALMRPNGNRLKYVIATGSDLAKEMTRALSKKPVRAKRPK